MENKNNTFKLGRSLAQILPFYRPQKQEPLAKEDSIITKKLLIVMAIVAIVKFAVLMLWI